MGGQSLEPNPGLQGRTREAQSRRRTAGRQTLSQEPSASSSSQSSPQYGPIHLGVRWGSRPQRQTSPHTTEGPQQGLSASFTPRLPFSTWGRTTCVERQLHGCPVGTSESQSLCKPCDPAPVTSLQASGALENREGQHHSSVNAVGGSNQGCDREAENLERAPLKVTLLP